MDFNSREFNDLYRYEGKLGAVYSEQETIFRIWSPVAESIKLKLYGKEGYDYKRDFTEIIPMNKLKNGVFEVIVNGDLHGEYYNYLVTIDGEEKEVVDIYAKAVGVNGKRGMVINLEKTNPKGWKEHSIPNFSPMDSIIYEMNVRDFTIDSNSALEKSLRGKYKGVVESGSTFINSAIKTGFDHLKDLGVNTVQLMPVFDYKTVNEEKFSEEEYNWGYDPLNYNVPEGSYSTNPYLGEVRIKEFKEMVMKFHENGFKVVMDVVYNHTFDTIESNFNKIFPKYYYRQNEDGSFSNGSGCGNELASERFMVRKFIVDSVKYWVEEYKIDGFRFDLMGLHDLDTMIEIRKELDKINENIIIYGEGWTGGNSPLSHDKSAVKFNINKLNNMQIGIFSDDIRDAIKGGVFYGKEGGFINGWDNYEESLKFGIVASVNHPDIDYNNVKYSKWPWANEPYQVITYTSAHDNYTLWDKISSVEEGLDEEERIKINKLAAAIILTSQGIPFIHSGDEILRTKQERDGTIIDNSYKSSDYVNKIDWGRKEKYIDIFNYYKGLINLRKNHEIFKLNKAEEIRENIKFLKFGKEIKDRNVVAYIANGNNINDTLGKIVVIFNGNKKPIEIKLNHDKFKVILNGDEIKESGLYNIEESTIKVDEVSALILSYIE